MDPSFLRRFLNFPSIFIKVVNNMTSKKVGKKTTHVPVQLLESRRYNFFLIYMTIFFLFFRKSMMNV